MIDVGDFIVGLMRENYEAVGFLPATTVWNQYMRNGRYILQADERGRPIGYLLHGALTPGGLAIVTQNCIDIDRRNRGYGEAAFQTLVQRAMAAGCRGLRLRCAEDLPSNGFWQQVGMEWTATQYPSNRRKRAIRIYYRSLWPTLFGHITGMEEVMVSER